MIDRKVLGRRIREERIRHRMTQEQVAAYIDVSTTYVGFIERGERAVTLEKLELLAQCFHVPIDSLLRENPEGSTAQAKAERLNNLWEASSMDEKDMILSFSEFIHSKKDEEREHKTPLA